MLTFQEESFASIQEELAPLIQEHAEELSPHKGKYQPMVSEIYRLLDKKGHLIAVTAREGEKLVGYCSFILAPSFHYLGVLNAEIDCFFLQKKYRKGLSGIRLLKSGEKACKERGATHIVQKCKVCQDLSPILERMGYEKIEYVFLKEV